jgi:glycosyltransferase involved in cell wall biosynthesis
MMPERAAARVALEESVLSTVLPIALIPAYKPSDKLLPLVESLRADRNIGHVVVIDDGSGPECAEIFQAVSQLDGVTLLRHVVNLGKGAALKTAFNYIAVNFINSVGILTADADGQHAPEDISEVARVLAQNPRKLILGGRTFDGDVPARSRFGNTLTRYVIRATIGYKLSDTQTGLRGIPMRFIPDLLNSKATRYDFELDMLLRWHQQGGEIAEVPIQTIYFEGNRGSHFNPLLDSMRVYFVFLRFASVSAITAAIDGLVFFVAFVASHQVLTSFIVGRAAGAIFNYLANKKEVFHSRASNATALPKYLAALVIAGFCGFFSIKGLVSLGLSVLLAKILTEGVLFFFSFIIQRAFVFSGGKRDASE